MLWLSALSYRASSISTNGSTSSPDGSGRSNREARRAKLFFSATFPVSGAAIVASASSGVSAPSRGLSTFWCTCCMVASTSSSTVPSSTTSLSSAVSVASGVCSVCSCSTYSISQSSGRICKDSSTSAPRRVPWLSGGVRRYVDLEGRLDSGRRPVGRTFSRIPSMAATEDLLSFAPSVQGANRSTILDTETTSTGSVRTMPKIQRNIRTPSGRKRNTCSTEQITTVATQYLLYFFTRYTYWATGVV